VSPTRSEWTAVQKTAGLSLSLLAFTSPEIVRQARGTAPSYPLITIVFTACVVAVVSMWKPATAPDPKVARSPWMAVALIASGVLVAVALRRWIDQMLWNGPRADMLIVIREATRHLLRGHNPYSTYRTYDAPWNMILPYGPGLWSPYLVLQWLRVDFRVLTIIGELFVPVWCGISAAVEARRGRAIAALSWIALLAAIVMSIDVPGFTVIGHTPVYWPLLLLLSAFVARRQWEGAAVTLGILVVSRTTMVVIVPVFAMAAWIDDRARARRTLAILATATLLPLLPFIVWDWRALWDSMIASYPRLMKDVVWRTEGWATNTIGLTGWLLAHHQQRFVELSGAVAMAAIYLIAWPRLRAGAPALPWMALALLVFSLTTLWPVYYIYFDVLLLFVAAAVVETVEPSRASIRLTSWAYVLAGIIVVVGASLRASAASHPDIVIGSPGAAQYLEQGFGGTEYDGANAFTWVTDRQATIALPRSSATDSSLMVTCSPFAGAGVPPVQTMAVVLNGVLLGSQRLGAGRQTVRFDAPGTAWWIGHNQVELAFTWAVSPKDIGEGADDRHLAAAITRIDVAAR
jgi:hypothetical protein